MQYTILKSIIETTITQYVCQTCKNKISSDVLDIQHISEGSLDFRIICSHCRTEAHMHAEIGNPQSNVIPQNFQNSGNIIHIQSQNQNQNGIKDSDIVNLEDSLKQKKSFEDLLN